MKEFLPCKRFFAVFNRCAKEKSRQTKSRQSTVETSPQVDSRLCLDKKDGPGCFRWVLHAR
jgi:hypothetical protein